MVDTTSQRVNTAGQPIQVTINVELQLSIFGQGAGCHRNNKAGAKCEVQVLGVRPSVHTFPGIAQKLLFWLCSSSPF